MTEATYGEVQDHLDRLIGSVHAELDHDTAELGRSDVPRFLSRLLVADLVLANLLLWLVLPDYSLYWITASFFLYVVYPFLFLVPSSGKSTGDGTEHPSGSLSERFGGTGLAEYRWTIAKIFWNSFFINSLPLAPAFIAIYNLNILFALLRGEGLIGWLIIFQSAAILIFYLAIAVLKPYTGGFLDSVIGLQNTVSAKMHRRVQPLWKIMLPIGLAAGVVAIVLIAAMLLPGFTLGVIWKSEATVTGLGFIPVLFVLASQIVLVRYAQGAASSRLVRQLRQRKIEILTRHVLAPLEAYRNQLTKPVPGVLDRFAQDFTDIRATFLSSKVYRMQVQDLEGLLPIHVVVPDLELVLNRETIQLLGDQPGSRQIL
ncbi:MAG: hypothetical protein ABFC38_04305 [Methanospirillum sp.]